MQCPPTVAVRRTDRQPPIRGRGLRVLCEPSGWLRTACPAAPRASARQRRPRCVPGAFGRWRCRWSTPLLLFALLRAVAGTRSMTGCTRSSTCPTTPSATAFSTATWPSTSAVRIPAASSRNAHRSSGHGSGANARAASVSSARQMHPALGSPADARRDLDDVVGFEWRQRACRAAHASCSTSRAGSSQSASRSA